MKSKEGNGMKVTYCVITKHDPRDVGVIFLVKDGAFLRQLAASELDKNNLDFLFANGQVFSPGEIIILDEPTGREIGGIQRKPSKWFSEYEEFDNVEDAIKRSKKVTKS